MVTGGRESISSKLSCMNFLQARVTDPKSLGLSRQIRVARFESPDLSRQTRHDSIRVQPRVEVFFIIPSYMTALQFLPSTFLPSFFFFSTFFSLFFSFFPLFFFLPSAHIEKLYNSFRVVGEAEVSGGSSATNTAEAKPRIHFSFQNK